MTISPGTYDITIYQGTTFNQQFTWRDQNNVLLDCRQLHRVKYLSCELHTGLAVSNLEALRKALKRHFTTDTLRACRVEKEKAEGFFA